MKNLNLLVWLTQLGISVALPPVLFIWLGLWLRSRFQLGNWIVIVTVLAGVFCAVDGFWKSLKVMERISTDQKKEEPPVSFNDHD